MSKFVVGDGRTHMHSGLMRESLVSRELNEATGAGAVRAMLPDVTFLAIGGQSIMDRGAAAVLPMVDTIAALSKDHKLVIGVGGGARARHTLAIGLDLGLPIGGLARIVGGVEEQNRDMLQLLLAPHGGITFVKDHFQDLSMFLSGGLIPVCIGQPPYHFWEPPPKKGRLPENGPDVGLFLMAEMIGVKRMIYAKDVDGIFDADPNKHKDAKLISEISAKALTAMNLPDLPIERELLICLENARLVDAITVVNGLEPEQVSRAVSGERVGTLVHKDKAGAAA